MPQRISDVPLAGPACVGDLRSSRRSLAIGVWSVLLIVDALLVTRRLSAQFVTPVPSSLALLTAVLVAVASGCAWSFFASSGSTPTRSLRLAAQGLCVAITLFWCWAISIDATPLTAGLLVGVVLLQAGALAAAELETTGSIPAGPPLLAPLVEPVSPPPLSMTALAATGFESAGIQEIDDEGAASGVDDETTLWLSRRAIEEGELIEGWVRISFAAGQRETAVHLSFCPPLAAPADLEAEDLDGTGLEVRVAAVFPFGARLSVRRTGVLDERHTDRVGFVVQSRTANRAA